MGRRFPTPGQDRWDRQPYLMSERSSYISWTSLSATSDHIYQSWPHGFVRSYERQVPDRPLSANQLLFLFKRRSIFLLVGNGHVSKMKVWVLKDSVFVILRLCWREQRGVGDWLDVVLSKFSHWLKLSESEREGGAHLGKSEITFWERCVADFFFCSPSSRGKGNMAVELSFHIFASLEDMFSCLHKPPKLAS